MSAVQPVIALLPQHRAIVCEILQALVPEHEVWAFGSRTQGMARQYSDLDLAVITARRLPLDVTAALREAFSESDLPWKVDVVDWAGLSPQFRKVVEGSKVVIQRPHDA